MTSLSQDMSILTTIPKFQIDNLFSKIICILGHDIHEGISRGENPISMDVGIGTLVVGVDEEELKYKFIPSSTLNATIKNTVSSGESPLVNLVEDRLKDRIINTYKDIL